MTQTASAPTASEAYLGELCRKAFLHLWSYPNLYRDQSKRGANADGKELCDLLVVFGDDVLIFSDKHCVLNREKPIEIAWRRWYQAAILKSAAQIRGAERWLLSYPERVFLDRQCTKPFPLRLPTEPHIHRIVTCRGAAELAQEVLGGPGSLIVTNDPMEDSAIRPFTLGSVDNGQFYHIFDEIAIDVALSTLDTVSDFCRYLRRKEAFCAKYGVFAAGEEELLGYYMWNTGPDGHDFVITQDATHVSLDEGFWLDWLQSPQRAAYVQANERSYFWDQLIDKFSFHMVNGTNLFASPGGVRETELSVRWMAREPRFRRRMLANDLLSMLATTRPGQARRRLFPPMQPGDPYWVFLVLPQPHFGTYDEYRDVRYHMLLDHCTVVKHLRPDALDIVGLALEATSDGTTEDVIYLNAREWPADLAEHAKAAYDEHGYFASATQMHRSEREFPVEEKSK